MASTFLPLVFNNLPPLIRSHHIWTIIWGVSLLASYPKIFLNKAMKYLLFYAFFLIIALNTILSSIDEWNYKTLLTELYQIAIGLSVFTYFIEKKDYIGLANLTKWAIVFIIITAVMTIISSAIDPLYARKIIGVSGVSNESEIENLITFKRFGGGGYSTAGAFMCLFPIFIYYYKNIELSIVSKRIIILFSILVFLALTGMQIFSNLLIAACFSIIAFLGMKKIKQSIAAIVLFLSILIFVPKEAYVNSLLFIGSNFTKGSELDLKFKDLAMFIELGSEIEEGGTGAGDRAVRYVELSETFVQAPILGCYFLPVNNAYGYFDHTINYGEIIQVEGTHLHWMNKLVITGIIGMAIFFFIPFNFIKNNFRRFDQTFKFYYILASLSIISYGFFKTVAGRETWYAFFILIPGLYYLPLLKKENKD
ncbi:MAG: hypothetical protein WCH34_00220 [Bacteroidota bacterium]